jgi:hypothetical protein
VINIINFTSKDNPSRSEGVPGDGRPTRDRGDRGEPVPRGRPGRGDPGGSSPRDPRRGGVWTALVAVLGDWLGGHSRRWGDRWYTPNDEEACWRGWQTTRTHGGLGRRYRDPAFDSLAECAWCRGAGVRADGRCAGCQGTGRISLGEVS